MDEDSVAQAPVDPPEVVQTEAAGGVEEIIADLEAKKAAALAV